MYVSVRKSRPLYWTHICQFLLFNLYDWIRRSKKSKHSKVQQAEFDEKFERLETDEYDREIINDETDELHMLADKVVSWSGGGELMIQLIVNHLMSQLMMMMQKLILVMN
jgi:hypothetical protein